MGLFLHSSAWQPPCQRKRTTCKPLLGKQIVPFFQILTDAIMLLRVRSLSVLCGRTPRECGVYTQYVLFHFEKVSRLTPAAWAAVLMVWCRSIKPWVYTRFTSSKVKSKMGA